MSLISTSLTFRPGSGSTPDAIEAKGAIALVDKASQSVRSTVGFVPRNVLVGMLLWLDQKRLTFYEEDEVCMMAHFSDLPQN